MTFISIIFTTLAIIVGIRAFVSLLNGDIISLCYQLFGTVILVIMSSTMWSDVKAEKESCKKPIEVVIRDESSYRKGKQFKIKRIEMYNPVYGETRCDNCNRKFGNGIESGYVFREDLENAGWVFSLGKLLCPDCASGNNIQYTKTNLLHR